MHVHTTNRCFLSVFTPGHFITEGYQADQAGFVPDGFTLTAPNHFAIYVDIELLRACSIISAGTETKLTNTFIPNSLSGVS